MLCMTPEERNQWLIEHGFMKKKLSKRLIRAFSGIKNRIPDVRNIRGFAKRHKRQGRYLLAKHLQRASHKLQRRLDKAEVEQQLTEPPPKLVYSAYYDSFICALW